MIENQHQPTKLNIRTYIDQRYKVTVYYDKEYGEIYDLLEDPFEYKNLWNSSHKDLKIQLLQKFISAEMAKAPRPMPRIAGA